MENQQSPRNPRRHWRSYCCCRLCDETLAVVQVDRRIGVLRKSALVRIAIFEFRFVEATRRSIIITPYCRYRHHPTRDDRLMASNVVVLHNNRRHVIKTTPSMLCRDILTQACEKIGYSRTEQYGLKYPLTLKTALLISRNGKNTLDLALPVRLSNLPAGAKLEIYKITASEGIPRPPSFSALNPDCLAFSLI